MNARTACGVMAAFIITGLCGASASAQTIRPFEVGAQIPVAHIGEIDATDTGIGVRVAWNVSPLLGVEGELNVSPRDLPDDVAVTGNRVEGLFGVTAGPRLGAWRPFARVRPGFVRFGEAPEPFLCPAIFPPPIACQLGGGTTQFAFDLGAGVEVSTSDRSLVRVDVGDRLIRYPGPAIDRDGEAHDGDFFGHGVRLAFGVGWRF